MLFYLFIIIPFHYKEIREARYIEAPYVGMAGNQNGGYMQCISVQTLIFHLVTNFIRLKTPRSALGRCHILQ